MWEDGCGEETTAKNVITFQAMSKKVVSFYKKNRVTP